MAKGDEKLPGGERRNREDALFVDLGATCAARRDVRVPLRAGPPRDVLLATPTGLASGFSSLGHGTRASLVGSTPCFCNRRYNEESPIPNRMRISAGHGEFRSPGRRVIADLLPNPLEHQPLRFARTPGGLGYPTQSAS